MSYQLPPLSDDEQFERLIRDILRRDCDDLGFERFGRSGQSQFGIDGFSPINPSIVFQCKLKDTRFENDARLRDKLLSELEEELKKTKGLTIQPQRFIFATTFKNDTQLQEKAKSLSNGSLTVEYWGWDTISEKIWEYAEFLIPIYYPQFPIRQVPGFRQITAHLITKYQTNNAEELNKLAIEYYRINDRDEVVLGVVCNNLDVRNEKVINYTFGRLKALPPSGTLWILGSGGSGKTTILHRLVIELSERNQNVYMLNLETLRKDDLETVLSWLKYGFTDKQTVLCIDNPAADEEILETLLRRIPDYCPEIHILLAERAHRYYALKRTGCLIYLHGEEEHQPVNVHNTSDQREKVYRKLFDLLNISEIDRAPLMKIALNEQIVYVNATYSILLELKRKEIIDFNFDWDDYRELTADLPAFHESYKYIALFYLFGVRTPFTVLSKIFGADISQQKTFQERFRGLVNEPIILDERRDDSYRKNIYVRTKHEIISEIFFREHPELNKDELLMEWCESIDFGNALEAQTLIDIFGAKKNYSVENPYINFSKLLNFLLQGYLHEKVALSPKLNATLHMAKFWLLIMQDKSSEAIKILETFLENVPDDLHSRTELAKVYQKQGKYTEAEAALLKILDIKANDLNSRIELAKVYQKQSRLTEAETVLLELLEIDKRSIRANTELARIYQRQNKLNEAESILLDVLDVKPKDLNSRTELAKIYQRQGKLEKAEAVLLESLAINPNELHARTELAKIYQRQNKLDKAEAVLLESLEIDSKQLHPRTELAKIYQRQGKLDKAETVLLESLAINPNELHARTELAKIYQRQGKLTEAEAVLLESLEIDSKQLHPRTELAKIYQRQGKLDEAEDLLLKILDIKPKDLNSRTELAKIYQRQGRWDEAIRRLEEYIELDAKGLHPRTELAKIYQRQNKLEKAEAVLLESLEIDNKQLHPRTELAKIYQRQGKLEKAEAVLLESLEIDNKQLHPRTELAKIYQRQGKLDEAVKRAEEVLTFDPLNDFVISELLAIWKQQGEKEKCVQRFMEFISQPNYRFSRYSQAPVFRFFQCCRVFRMKEDAEQVFERFKAELDDQNYNYYMTNFK